MGEFASKGVAGTGLGLGIAGTALGVLAGGANGLLGGLWGGNAGAVGAASGFATLGVLAEKDAKIAELEAQKYSDTTGVALYQKTLENTKGLRDEIMAALSPVAQEAAANRERVAVLEAQVRSENEKSVLREKLVRSELGAKIDNVALTCGNGLNQLNGAVAAINATLGQITKQVVPQSAICPAVMPLYNSWVAPTSTTTSTDDTTTTS